MRAELTAFFERFRAGDSVGDCFADVFLAGDAAGIKPVTRQVFLESLPKRAEMLARAGLQSPALADLSFESLDDHYILARTVWTAGAGRLASSYLLHRRDGALRVVVYLNHEGLGV
jgi:hypothetical protein